MAKVTKNKEKEFEDIPVCAYAGDKEDEYCSGCNGKTMEIDGQIFSCKECQSYTPTPEPPTLEPNDTPVETVQQAGEDTETAAADTYTSQGITTSIKAESGLSIETKKGWYRFSYTEERIIPESADIEKEREALWNDVNNEVDRQAEEIRLMLAGK